MGIIGWIVLGTLVGLLANWLVPGRFPGGFFGTVVGGTLGALLGGLLFSSVADRGVSGFDLASVVIAFVGAAFLLTLLSLAGGNGTLAGRARAAEGQRQWPER
jgi:uncharacterized membrane protein YeaQ/YmgE (transglycosylase-associated protein family)